MDGKTLLDSFFALPLEQQAKHDPVNPYGELNPGIPGSYAFAQAAKRVNSAIAYAQSEIRRRSNS
jgi:hypothetical protein